MDKLCDHIVCNDLYEGKLCKIGPERCWADNCNEEAVILMYVPIELSEKATFSAQKIYQYCKKHIGYHLKEGQLFDSKPLKDHDLDRKLEFLEAERKIRSQKLSLSKDSTKLLYIWKKDVI